MNQFPQPQEELTEVTINSDVLEFMTINNGEICNAEDFNIDVENSIQSTIIMLQPMLTNNPDVETQNEVVKKPHSPLKKPKVQAVSRICKLNQGLPKINQNCFSKVQVPFLPSSANEKSQAYSKLKEISKVPVFSIQSDKKYQPLPTNKTKVSEKPKTTAKPDGEVTDEFRPLSLDEIMDLWSELSKIPTPQCKCDKLRIQQLKK